MKPAMPVLWSVIVVASSAMAGQVFGKNMSSESDRALAAAQASGWDTDDVLMAEDSAMRQGHCRFFRATHKRVLGRPTLEFAVLKSDEVVGGDPSQGLAGAAARILGTCGADAPPAWWANVIVRFSGQASGNVLLEGNERAKNDVTRMGQTYAGPTLLSEQGRTEIAFFTQAFEPERYYRVVASLDSDGVLTVENRLITTS